MFKYLPICKAFMSKKGIELTMQTIIVAVLMLIVLVVLIMVFRGQIGKSSQRYFAIGNQSEQELQATDKCMTLFGNRRCLNECPVEEIKVPGGESRYVVWTPVPAGAKGWSDCKATCCERIEG